MSSGSSGARIGLTGATGYLGGPLVATLRDHGYEVIPTSRSGPLDEIGGRNVDVRDKDEIEAALGDVDLILHLAGISGVGECRSNPTRAFETNVQGTENVAWTCRTHGIPLVFLSSVVAIGDPRDTPIDVDHDCAPTTLYGLTKCMSERDIELLADGSFEAAVVRLANTYGIYAGADDDSPVFQREKPGSVIHLFVDRALDGEPITVHAPGTQARDFVWVSDASNAILGVCTYLLDEPVALGAETFHVGSGESWTVADVAELVRAEVKAEYGLDPVVETVDPDERDPDPTRISVDVSKLRDYTGFEPEYSLREGIRRLIRLKGG